MIAVFKLKITSSWIFQDDYWTFRFDSTTVFWEKIFVIIFSFFFLFFLSSHREINKFAIESRRGATSNDVYVAQITWSTIRGRDNRDDPFSFPAWLFYARRLFDEGQPVIDDRHWFSRPIISQLPAPPTGWRSGFNRPLCAINTVYD